jgi:Ca2+:H+ antiporter
MKYPHYNTLKGGEDEDEEVKDEEVEEEDKKLTKSGNGDDDMNKYNHSDATWHNSGEIHHGSDKIEIPSSSKKINSITMAFKMVSYAKRLSRRNIMMMDKNDNLEPNLTLARKQSVRGLLTNKDGFVAAATVGNNNDDDLAWKSDTSLRKSYTALTNDKIHNDDGNDHDNSDRDTSVNDSNEFQSAWKALDEIIFGKVVSIFLALIPFCFLAKNLHWGAIWVFWSNFLVMIPLASILGDFTEEVAAHTNQIVGGLINATFGNAVEVVVAIQALLANEIRVVQASMIGSIFSNLLLVLGCCFFFGGLRYREQSFNPTVATANMSLLALSSLALILPTPFASYYEINDSRVLLVSRTAAIFLISMYIQLLIFQLRTHSYIFDDDEDDDPRLSMRASLLGLLVSTLAITVFSDMLVESIDGFVVSTGISRTFVGLVILPIVGNAVEHITAVTVAMKNKMDLAMGVAVGSCTQISLFVVPVTVLVGWALNRNMTLNFPKFEISLFIMSVIIVSICLSNPTGNWLLGSLLITTYIMVAVGFFFEDVEDF